MEGVERDVVYDGRVACVDGCSSDFGTGTLEACDIPAIRQAQKYYRLPVTDGGVIRGSDEMTLFMWIPRDPVTLSSVSFKTNVWFTVIATRRVRVFCPIKDENVSRDGHSSNNIWVLRLISRAIHFSFMHNFLRNGNPTLKSRVSSKFYHQLHRSNKTGFVTTPVFIVAGEFGAGGRELNICNLKKVLVCARCVCANQKTMCRIVLAGFASGGQARSRTRGRKGDSTSLCQGTIGWSRWAIQEHE